MRFNDLLQTVLAAEGSGAGAVTLWRQCVDLLAQNDRPGRPPLDEQERMLLLERLERLRGEVSETQRIATVVELGTRLSSPTLIHLFAADRPAICAAAMARARLPDRAWLPLLPHLGPTARGVLRGRRDMGPETVRALQSFGKTDLLLTGAAGDPMLLTPDMAAPAPDAPAPAREDAEGQSQIRRLVDRIERFTSQRPKPVAAVADAIPSRNFAFETDSQGVLIWVADAPRAVLIGLTIAEPALPGGSGPDANVAGAFARRSAFQNGRFLMEGGALAGEWRMSAVPFFDPRSGRFQGFRGQARRPHLHEVPPARTEAEGALSSLSSDSIRQLVHELRTPLNAILGFAEIIEQQLFGPAADQYRDMAGQIVADARQLLTAFEDLDLAARLARGVESADPRPVDAALLVTRVASRFGNDHAHAAPIDIAVTPDLPAVRLDPVQGERMVQHLLRTLVSVTPEGEAVTGSCWFQPGPQGGQVVLAMNRPSSLADMEEAQLLDPGYGPDGEWPDGSLLGLGFSLRLIRSLAANGDGGLTIEPDRFVLTLPAVAEEADLDAAPA